MTAPAPAPFRWNTVLRAANRPYRVTAPMVILVSLVPLYIFIAAEVRGRTTYVPEVGLDRVIPLQPAWSIVYGSLYLFLILLPVFVVSQQEHIRRTVLAYLAVWMTAYVCFLVFPTKAPRADEVIGDGFGAWGLRFLYGADPPYNCFPSLHVAHSFVSALTSYRVHRGLGVAALTCASLVALSTLFTKQHYVLDVIAGILMAWIACRLFLRGYPAAAIPEIERRVAPPLALVVAVLVGLGLAGSWVAYLLSR